MQIKRRQLIEDTHLPLIERLYQARGVTLEEARTDLASLLPYHLLLNIDKASERLVKAVTCQQRMLIIGDFDADGATASALAVSALRVMGAQHVDFLVPNRFSFGYGLTVGIVEQAFLLKPDLIITVDNGISNIEGVERAKSLGMDVLITDHHLAGAVLPEADVIINPNQPHDTFPSKAIAGVGVVFYVMSALRRALEAQGWFSQIGHDVPNMAQFLDLVALGTVADVVPLDRNNRIMVKHGLMRIQKGLARPGIEALINVSGRIRHQLKASDLGFALAPRLNAAGRLDDMSLGINCLLSESLEQAKSMASQLDELNVERRQIEAEMQEQALQHLQQAFGSVGMHTSAICLYHETWHQGVIGILAGRLKDKFKKPTIIFANGDAGELKGSARSVQGIHIRDILAAIDSHHPELIIKFGGHAMAAGLAIAREDFQKFTQIFDHQIELLNYEPQTSVWTDGELHIDDLTMNTADLIQQAGPWGQMFPEPCFDNVFKIIEQRIVGQKHLKLLLQIVGGQQMIDAIAFNIDTEVWPQHRAQYVRMVYQLDINEYQGRRRLQLMVQCLEAVDAPELSESSHV